MKRSVWVFSVLLATVLLLGHWIPGLSAAANLDSSTRTALASTEFEPIIPAEHDSIEAMAHDFTTRYYTYTLDNYLEEGEKLLPILTQSYQQGYRESLTKSFEAAKAVDAASSVESLVTTGIEKTATDSSLIRVQFKARVMTHEVETLNRYNIVLELKKEAGGWLINDILEEEPVSFSNLQSLL